ncbi:MAG: pirin family protein [Euryarchaeota archaeon]|nr:pirin family protein [Euryarchaeota archaeon]
MAPRPAEGAGDPERHYVPPDKSKPLQADPDLSRRTIEDVFGTNETMEGAGVRLQRAFGAHEVPKLDPFLLLDDFRSDDPADYEAGFPWHPHRGIQTVTYMLDGYVEHGDSLGNAGRIGPGDVQWMSAGSGIIHQEMPKGRKDVMGGMQLWVNIPADDKMSTPLYQEFQSKHIPEVKKDGSIVRVIAGSYLGNEGPVKNIQVDPQYLDVRLEPGRVFEHRVPAGDRTFAYVLDGQARFEEGRDPFGARSVIIFEEGDLVRVETTGQPVRFILVSGRPLKEPVAWYGPIVMNTQKELEKAIEDLQNDTFVKTKASGRGDLEEMRKA